MRWTLGGVLLCSACVTSAAVECDFGTCPTGTVCDSTHELCVSPDQLGCGENGDDCTVIDPSDGTCDQGVCLLDRCGDGYPQGAEQCDGEDLGTTLCDELGFYDATAPGCKADCTYDVGVCTGRCGDGEVRYGVEYCEPMLGPPNQTCTDLGYGAGFLDCNEACGPALDDCKLFGWNPPRFATASLKNLRATSPANIWASGTDSKAIHFDGFSWIEYDVSSCLPAPATLAGLWSLGEGEAYVTGGNGIARVTPAGCTSLMPISSMQLIDTVWASSTSDIYTMSLGGLHHFDGTAWTQITISGLPSVGLSALWGSGPDDVWLGRGTALRHWTGTTWETPVGPTSTMQIRAIWGSSPTDVYVGGYVSSTGVVWHYDGSWSQILGYAGQVHSGAVANGRVFIGGTRTVATQTRSVVMSYDGTTWTDLSVPSVTGSILGLSALANGHLFGITDNSTRIHSYEGSAHVPGPAGGFSSGHLLSTVHMMTPSRAYAIALESLFVVVGHLYTWNGGATWSLDDTMDGVKAIALDRDSDTVFAIGLNGFRSSTGGAAFVDLDVSISGSVVWGSAPDDAWVYLDGTNELRRWDGTALATCPTCTGIPIVRAIWGSGPSDVYAVGDGALHWDGSAWSAVPVTGSGELGGVWGSSASDVYVVGQSGDVFHFDGSTWSDVSVDTPLALHAVWGTGPGDVFVAGLDGVMYHRDAKGRWAPVASQSSENTLSLDGVGDTMIYVDGPSSARRLIRTAPW